MGCRYLEDVIQAGIDSVDYQSEVKSSTKLGYFGLYKFILGSEQVCCKVMFLMFLMKDMLIKRYLELLFW